MIKRIAQSLGIHDMRYPDDFLTLMIVKEIERLKDVEQACRWGKVITHDPEYAMNAAISAYEQWSIVGTLDKSRSSYRMGDL